MKKETRIGILAIVTIILAILGYNFLKGKDFFSSTNTYKVIYNNVDQLVVSDPVLINGYKIGQIVNIKLDPKNVKSLEVSISVSSDIPVPKNAVAVIKSSGMLGGKFISLEFNKACNGTNCAQDGDAIRGRQQGFLEAYVGKPEDLKEYGEVIADSAGPTLDSLLKAADTMSVGRTMSNIEISTQNLKALSKKLDLLLAQSNNDLLATTQNISKITNNIAANNSKINRIISNLDSATQKVAQLDIKKPVDELNKTLVSLKSTLESSKTAIANINEMTTSLAEGKGTLGKLINEEDLYNNLNRTIKNTDLLLQDFRLNPKRYINVSVFGKKQKAYELPADDPAKEKLKN